MHLQELTERCQAILQLEVLRFCNTKVQWQVVQVLPEQVHPFPISHPGVHQESLQP